MTLEDERKAILNQIEVPLEDFEVWWRYNNRFKNYFFTANLVFSLGATIFGLLKMPIRAGISGAVLTAILAVQKQINFDNEASWYGGALARCKVLKNKTNSPYATSESLKAVEDELNQIVGGEANKSKSLKPDSDQNPTPKL
jgi:hypothetical protein